MALFTAAVFLGLLLIPLAQEGMFMDGLLYAVVAHNEANGFGSFWEPRYSQLGMAGSTIFREHPPLTFGLQAMWFRLLGSGFWVERLYCLVAAIGTAWLIVLIWRTLVSGHPGMKHLAWWPVLLWIIVPPVHWCFQNNMQENTMGLFTAAAVLLVLLADGGQRYWSTLALASVCVMAALMTKGPPAAFPLAAPLLVGLAMKRRPAWQAFLGSALMTGLVVAGFALLMLHPPANASLTAYVNERLLHRIDAQHTVESRFTVLFDLLPAMLGPLLLTLMVWHLGKRGISQVEAQSKEFHRPALAMLLVGASGILPLMLTKVQKAFYMAAALPYLSLSLALISAPFVIILTDRIGQQPALGRAVGRFSVVCLVGVLVAAAIRFGKPSRDAGLLHDVRLIGEHVPHGSLIGVDPSLWNAWNLQSYLLRYHAISLDPSSTPHPWHLAPLEPGNAPGQMVTAPPPLSELRLWKRSAAGPIPAR